MVVDVYGQQYEWHFNYPSQGVTSRELHVPIDRQVEFRMHSLDVVHSFCPSGGSRRTPSPASPPARYIAPDKTGNYTWSAPTLRLRPRDDEGAGQCGGFTGSLRPVVADTATNPESEPKPGETTPTRLKQ
jgi:hypothetical protein